MLLMLTAQLVLPALLLAWLALRPLQRTAFHILQVMCVGLVLVSVALAGLWLIIPWWMPYIYGVLFLLAVIGTFVRRRSQTHATIRTGWIDRLLLATASVLAIYGTYLGGLALAGRYPADVRVVDIQSPLGTGTYLVAQGGSNLTVNGHMMTLDQSVPRFAAWRGQSKALDIVKINGFGFRADGVLPEDPNRFHSFGVDILAPCDGHILEVTDGLKDMPVPQMDREHMLGNHVVINCGAFFVVLAHLKNGSVAARLGEEVETGTRLGAIGNSGNSAEPHLHIHVQATLPQDLPISGEPLAFTIDGKFYARNDRMVVR